MSVDNASISRESRLTKKKFASAVEHLIESSVTRVAVHIAMNVSQEMEAGIFAAPGVNPLRLWSLLVEPSTMMALEKL